MISLRDHGLLERAQVQVTGDYTEQQLALSYNAIIGGVVTGGIAAIEAVAGLWAYRETLRPGDLTDVAGEQQVLAGGMMKSGAAEVLRGETWRVQL